MEVPPIVRFRINAPLWIEDCIAEMPPTYIETDFGGEIRLPAAVRKHFDFVDLMKWTTRISKYAEHEFLLMLDDKSYKKSREGYG